MFYQNFSQEKARSFMASLDAYPVRDVFSRLKISPKGNILSISSSAVIDSANPVSYSIVMHKSMTKNHVIGSFEDFPFRDNFFDFVFTDSITFAKKPFHFLNECKRIAKPGSYVILSFDRATAKRFGSALNKKKLKNLITSSGLKLLKSLSLGPLLIFHAKADKHYIPAHVRELCSSCGTCFNNHLLSQSVCPGVYVNFKQLNQVVFNRQPDSPVGNYNAAYVAYSRRAKLRASASSGGVVTQLLVDLMLSKKINFAVVVGFNKNIPWLPKPVIAKTPDEIIESAQSKYTVNFLNQTLSFIHNNKGNYAVVALPCQVHAIRTLQQKDPILKTRIKYLIGLYCGNILMTDSVLHTIKKFRADKKDIVKIEYRHGNWPGGFFLKTKKKEYTMPKFYWNHLIPFFIQERCLYCIDLSNEFADISVGDAWLPELEKQKKGYSVVISRTKKGKELLKSKNIVLKEITESQLLSMHSHLYDFKKKGAFIRMQLRASKGRPIPFYNVDFPAIGFTRKIKEYIIVFVLSITRTKLAKKMLLFVPSSFLGFAINTLKKIWKKQNWSFYKKIK